MKNENKRFKGILQIVVLICFVAYNYITTLNINSINNKISYIDNKIELSNYNTSNIPDLLAVNKRYINFLERITQPFEADVDYLKSLDKIKAEAVVGYAGSKEAEFI